MSAPICMTELTEIWQDDNSTAVWFLFFLSLSARHISFFPFFLSLYGLNFLIIHTFLLPFSIYKSVHFYVNRCIILMSWYFSFASFRLWVSFYFPFCVFTSLVLSFSLSWKEPCEKHSSSKRSVTFCTISLVSASFCMPLQSCVEEAVTFTGMWVSTAPELETQMWGQSSRLNALDHCRLHPACLLCFKRAAKCKDADEITAALIRMAWLYSLSWRAPVTELGLNVS